jgi:Asp/Glu/hydantoin racemase
MTNPRIALIHALAGSVDPIGAAFAQRWPQARPFNLLDDSLSLDRAADGELTDAMVERFVRLTRYAVDTGSDGILFTCSAFHSAIDTARDGLDMPVLKPDEAMMEAALEVGARITMLATFEPTLGTASAELKSIAAREGKTVEVRAVHVPGALAALQSGDAATHERLIREMAAAAQTDCDVLLLAQFTMAPTAPAVEEVVNVPVLTSPGAAVDKLKRLLEG